MKLDGIRVVDLSMFLPGPVMTQMMADHGADVIRVEPPGGEPSRQFGPFDADGMSIWFKSIHRGKRSIVLDLKSPDDLEVLYRLADGADVFVEGFRPGVAARLGIGAAALRARNPGLIYCSLSAFGQSGPLSPKASHDMGAQAYTGFLALNDGGDGRPVVPGLPSADMGSALTGLVGVLMALYRRAATGRGDVVDAAMYDALIAWTAHLSGPVIADRVSPTTRTHRSIGGSAFYNVYETRDGRYIALTGREMKFARALLTALDRADLVAAAEADPGPAQQCLIAELQAIFRTRDHGDWCQLLASLEVSWAPVLTMVEAFDHPHAAARAILLDDGKGGRVIGTPVKFAEEPGRPVLDAPNLDAEGGSIRRAGWGKPRSVPELKAHIVDEIARPERID